MTRFKLGTFLLLMSSILWAQKPLHDNWQFRKHGELNWQEASVPGTVHQDLMRIDRIANVFYENNADSCLWVEKESWEYRRTLEIPVRPARIVFEGLDTYAQIFIDDSLVMETANMFRSYYLNLESFRAGTYDLKIRFISPYSYHKKAVADFGISLPSGSESGELKVMPFSRKAAYHFGWDWAPRMVTCGIYRPVYLEFTDEAKIERVNTTTHALRNGAAFVGHQIILNGRYKGLSIEWEGKEYPLSQWIGTEEVSADEFVFNRKISEPMLWWPRAYGEPNLYYDTLRLKRGDSILQVFPFRFGLRQVELVQEKDSIGTSFYFKINGKRIFARGANYIPQDMLLPRVRNKDYRDLLKLAADANMNMLRVWGGGVYEKDIFYQVCDSLGIMVWQDFMFAGTMYPVSTEFKREVQEEVAYNVRRLAGHPSIVVWCGNNEIDVAWHNWGWQKQYGYSRADSTRLWQGYQELFESLIPKTLSFYDSDQRPYVATSPLSNWGSPENFKHGSMHYWGVWHGGDDFEDFEKNVGRFMVEYGFQSFPNHQTLRRYIQPANYNLESEAMQYRQKSYIGNQEIQRQTLKYYGEARDFTQFIAHSQAVQYKALDMAIEAHRLNMGHCMGSLMWQLNDCWPGPSWSIIDYQGKTKSSYAAVQKGFRPDFWTIKDKVIYLVIEEPKEVEITLRFKLSDQSMRSIVVRRSYETTGVYSLDLNALAETKNLIKEAGLRYIEMNFINQ